MRMPTKAHSTAPVAVMLVAGTLLLSACSGDISSPTGLAPAAPSMANVPFHFNPGQGNKKVLGPGETVVYVFTIDPRRDNVLDMGTQLLEMPANSVCGAGSGYGTGTWTKPCTPQTAPVTITATVIGTSTLPRVEFQPAMRFNPDAADVQLYMFAKHASASDARDFDILYCSGMSNSNCHDESKDDASLITKYSTRANEVFRKIRHFSGYVVAERDVASLLP